MESLKLKYHSLIDTLVTKNGYSSERFKVFSTVLSDIYIKEPSFLYNELDRGINSEKQIHKLYYLTEFIRAEGLLYDGNIILLNLLLKICLQLIYSYENEQIKTLLIFRVIRTVYDIIFHQVDIYQSQEHDAKDILESDSESTKMYVDLSVKLLNKKYYQLYKSKDYGFDGCIYFILMICCDEQRYREEFLKLWNNIQYYILDYGKDDVISECWIEAYEEIKNT